MMRRFPRRARRGDASGGEKSLRVEVRDGPRSARMALYGEFDIACADDAGRTLQELLRRGLDSVVVDLSGLGFMDSTGVKFLVDGRDTARALGVRLTLVPGGDPVQRVLTVSGVTALFEDADGGTI